MKLRVLAAAIAVIAVPIAVQGAEGPSGSSSEARRTCEVNVPTGSRLGGIRRCRTKSERDAAKAENKSVVDRIQSQKNYTEAMAGMGARAMCRSMPRGC